MTVQHICNHNSICYQVIATFLSSLWYNTPNFTSKKQALTGATKSTKKLTNTTNQVAVTKMMHIENPDHNKKQNL